MSFFYILQMLTHAKHYLLTSVYDPNISDFIPLSRISCSETKAW